MRQIDKDKPIIGKAAKNINFDKIVLLELENKAKKENTTVSNIVNFIVRGAIMSDKEYYRFLMKYYNTKFHEARFMAEQIDIERQTK